MQNLLMNSNLFTSCFKQDLKAAFGWWFGLLLLLIGQCSFGAYFIHSTQPDILLDFIWYVETWGVWLPASPLLFAAYNKLLINHSINVKNVASIAGYFLAATLLFQFLLLVIIKQSYSYLHIWQYFTIRYIAAIMGITLIWSWKNRASLATIFAKVIQEETTTFQEQNASEDNSLVVYKGRDKCLISPEKIQAVIAAKNYLEIICDDGEYLMRGTIKNMELFLSKHEFTRIHRSALIRLPAVSRFKTLSSGSGLAILKNGFEVPVNKNFMISLNRCNIVKLG